jgi:ABC-type multidrug transport system permease subunit
MSSRTPSPLVELTLARLREFLREPEALFWVFAFPVLMALALGIAFRSQKPADVQVGVLQTEGAEAIASALTAAGGIRVRTLPSHEADVALRNGVIAVLVVPGQPGTPGTSGTSGLPIASIPPGTAPLPPTFRYDPNRPESTFARLQADAALQRAAGRRDVWTAHDEKVTTPGSRYIDWLLPGLLGMNIMGTGLWSIGFGVVLARMRKLLKRLMATPMPRSSYLLSHLLARLLFLSLEIPVLLIFGRVAFGVIIQGSLFAVAALCLLGAFSFAGLGLLLASRARTLEAVSGLMNVAMLPMWLLSGVFFASSNFPDVAQPFIQALPLTALNNALRAVMIEGQSLAGVVREISILGAWGIVTFSLALKLFRWR